MHRSGKHPRRRGLTQVELLIGLLITVLTLGALATFALSMGQAWRSAGEVENAQLRSVQATGRIHEMVRTARYLGWAGSRADGSGAALLMWRADVNNDGRMQLSEIGLVEHRKNQKTVSVYLLPPTAANANTLGDIRDIDAEADVTAFAALPGVKAQVLSRDVAEASFAVKNRDHAKLRPALAYEVKTERSARSFGESQVVAVRAPKSKPVRCDSLASCTCVSNTCLCGTPDACACSGDQPCRSAGGTSCHQPMTTVFSTVSASGTTAGAQ